MKVYSEEKVDTVDPIMCLEPSCLEPSCLEPSSLAKMLVRASMQHNSSSLLTASRLALETCRSAGAKLLAQVQNLEQEEKSNVPFNEISETIFQAVIAPFLGIVEKGRVRIASKRVYSNMMGEPLDLFNFEGIGREQLISLAFYRNITKKQECSCVAGRLLMALRTSNELFPNYSVVSRTSLSEMGFSPPWNLVGLQYTVGRDEDLSDFIPLLTTFTSLRRLKLIVTYGGSTKLVMAPVWNLVNLSHLCIHGSNCPENIDGVLNLSDLRVLNLSVTRVHGNLASVSHFMNLSELCLNNTQVHGDLASLCDLINLRRLDLDQTQVYGDLASLSGMRDLEVLFLSDNLMVVGQLGSLSSLLKLQRLYLGITNVEGELASISVLTDLRMVDLHGTRVQGNLESIASMRKLQKVILGDTELGGSILSLSDLLEISVLQINNTAINPTDAERFQFRREHPWCFLATT